MSTTFENILARDGVLVYRTKGVSMEPMLRQNRDLVTIRVPASRLKKYDVALYRRGDNYVLHRVIGVKPDHYLIRGDNTFVVEIVPDSRVIGVLTDFVRKGRQRRVSDRSYRCYAHIWNAVYPLRYAWRRLLGLMKRAARKLGITPLIKRLLGRADGMRVK